MIKEITLTAAEQATTNAGTFNYNKVRVMKISWAVGQLSALIEIGRMNVGEWEMFRDLTKSIQTHHYPAHVIIHPWSVTGADHWAVSSQLSSVMPRLTIMSAPAL